jgi:hypothetical protein
MTLTVTVIQVLNAHIHGMNSRLRFAAQNLGNRSATRMNAGFVVSV